MHSHIASAAIKILSYNEWKSEPEMSNITELMSYTKHVAL